MEKVIITALKAIIKHENKYLIAQRSANDEVAPNMWEFPGGRLEFGESLEGALLREIKEETNLNVTVDKLLYATTFKTHEYRQLVILTYLCTANECAVSLSQEHQKYLWVEKERIKTTLHRPIVDEIDKNRIWEMI